MAVFGKGVFIKAEDGTDIEILEFLAEGAQGEIYRACNCGRETALKWYKLPAPSEEFRLNLVCNIDKGIPDERFLWPRKLTARVGGSFGYLMDICPEGYFGLGKFLLDKNINFRSWKVML